VGRELTSSPATLGKSEAVKVGSRELVSLGKKKKGRKEKILRHKEGDISSPWRESRLGGIRI